jgi:KUP system potassium uptake protein
VNFDPDHTTFFLGRERIEVTERAGMAIWREHLFALMARNASDPTAHFGIPPDQAVDVGTHIDI